MSETINIEKIEIPGNELTIRTGEASKIKEYKPIIIKGSIDSPWEFFKKMELTSEVPPKAMVPPQVIVAGNSSLFGRSLLIPETMRANPGNCIVIVDFKQRTMLLVVNPMDPEFKISVEGRLKESMELVDSKVYYGIGTPSHMLRADFVKHLRYNSHLFERNEAFNNAVSKMNSLIVKIETDVQEASDNQGNKKSLYEKKVADIGLSPLKMQIPLFDGSSNNAELTVEINYEVINDRLNFYLDCPSLKRMMETEYASLIEVLVKNFDDKGVPVIQGESATIQ